MSALAYLKSTVPMTSPAIAIRIRKGLRPPSPGLSYWLGRVPAYSIKIPSSSRTTHLGASYSLATQSGINSTINQIYFFMSQTRDQRFTNYFL